MPAPRKYEQDFVDRAVELYVDRRREHPSEAKIESRRQVCALLDLNQATLRNWVEDAERASGARPSVPSRPVRGRAADEEPVDLAEVRALRQELAELRRANDILKSASAYFAQAVLDRRSR